MDDRLGDDNFTPQPDLIPYLSGQSYSHASKEERNRILQLLIAWIARVNRLLSLDGDRFPELMAALPEYFRTLFEKELLKHFSKERGE